MGVATRMLQRRGEDVEDVDKLGEGRERIGVSDMPRRVTGEGIMASVD